MKDSEAAVAPMADETLHATDDGMKIYVDCEFIEDGRTIDLISIGMVTEEGCCEYYAVSSEFSMVALAASPWLMENVWPSLPKIYGDARMYVMARAGWCPKWLRRRLPSLDLAIRARGLSDIVDWGHADVKSRTRIAREVQGFILKHASPQLWAWYGAYDHVAYAQLFGRMIDLPDGLPMFTNDLKQECVRLGDPRVPEQESGQHNALGDARHNRVIARFLAELAAPSGAPGRGGDTP